MTDLYRHAMRRAIWILATVGVLLYLGSALAGTDGTTAPTETPVPAAPLPPEATSLSLSLSTTEGSYGERIEATGALLPAQGGKEIALELATGDVWARVGTATTDGFGSYAVSFDAVAAGSVRAVQVDSGLASPVVELAVVPVVRVKATKSQAFGKARVEIVVAPTSYAGRMKAVVRRDGKEVAHANGRVRNGRGVVSVPTPGVGVFWVELELPAAAGFSARSIGAKIVAAGRRLALGATGPDVRALRDRLAALRFHVPARSSSFGSDLYDSVVAFQKAYRLDRSGVVDLATWKALARAAVLKPRYRGPAHHIEVDKTRQILMEVRGGNVVAVLPVSTGATGNTPEGRHQIRWKAPATTTWLGPAILYRTLTFYGNSFAIHGFPSVPAYPASHGCVRIPIWAADWLYQRSPVGETVYVYR